jgi:hypothetical protein
VVALAAGRGRCTAADYTLEQAQSSARPGVEPQTASAARTKTAMAAQLSRSETAARRSVASSRHCTDSIAESWCAAARRAVTEQKAKVAAGVGLRAEDTAAVESAAVRGTIPKSGPVQGHQMDEEADPRRYLLQEASEETCEHSHLDPGQPTKPGFGVEPADRRSQREKDVQHRMVQQDQRGLSSKAQPGSTERQSGTRALLQRRR